MCLCCAASLESLFLNAVGSMLVIVCGRVSCGVGIVGLVAGVLYTLGRCCECWGLTECDVVLGVCVPSVMSKRSSILSLSGVGSLCEFSVYIGAVLGVGSSVTFLSGVGSIGVFRIVKSGIRVGSV